MIDALVVVIAAPERLDALCARIDADEVLAFSDADVLRALDAISARQPARVVLSQRFASSSRGMALINRLRADPALEHIAIDAIGEHPDGPPVVARAPSAAAPAQAESATLPVAVEAPAPPLDWHGTRRAARVPIGDGVEVVIDGSAARLVNLSGIGAQVVSNLVLKPNQRVRVSLVDDSGSVRCAGLVAWATFELPRAGEPGAQYRAGIAFTEGKADAVEAFARRHRRQ